MAMMKNSDLQGNLTLKGALWQRSQYSLLTDREQSPETIQRI